MKHLRRTFVPAVAVVLALSTAGCGLGDKAADKAVGKALSSDGEEVTVDSGSGSVKVETEDGTVAFGEGLELPDEFPSDAPLPRGDYTVLSSSTNGGEVGLMLQVEGLELEGEQAHFEGELADAGWTVGDDKFSSTTAEGGMFSLSATKDGRTLSVVVSAEGTEGSVLYSVAEG